MSDFFNAYMLGAVTTAIIFMVIVGIFALTGPLE